MMVNQALAERYFRGVDPIGQQLQFPGNPKRPVDDRRRRRRHAHRRAEPPAPSRRSTCPSGRAARSRSTWSCARNPTRAHWSALVRREVQAVDPTASVERATTMEQIRRESLAPQTFAMRLLFGFAVVATALALVGIYGVLSLSVGSRLKEIAVRKAIGAQQQQILRSILGEGGRMILIGVVAGAFVAVAHRTSARRAAVWSGVSRSRLAGRGGSHLRHRRNGRLRVTRSTRRTGGLAGRAEARVSRRPRIGRKLIGRFEQQQRAGEAEHADRQAPSPKAQAPSPAEGRRQKAEGRRAEGREGYSDPGAVPSITAVIQSRTDEIRVKTP